jgi:hypothetical protein
MRKLKGIKSSESSAAIVWTGEENQSKSMFICRQIESDLDYPFRLPQNVPIAFGDIEWSAEVHAQSTAALTYFRICFDQHDPESGPV